MLLSFAASAEDPISGGRHKVIGSKPLFIPPQTSTIASHLPKAVGAAFSIGIAKMLKLEDTPLPPRFDRPRQLRRRLGQPFDRPGRVQHRRLGRLSGQPDAARLPVRGQWHRHLDPHPARLDRGLVPEPRRARHVRCSGLDMVDAYRGALEAARIARTQRRPVFLHMDCVRLYGHAGSDVQATYLSKAQIEADEERDPLLYSAALLVEQDLLSGAEILDIYNETEATLARIAEQAIARPKLTTSKDGDGEHRPAEARAAPRQHADARAARGPVRARPQHDGQAAAYGAAAELGARRSDARASQIIVAGEDVGPKGGVYNVTAKLHERFGSAG
jgi:2-oxoisovalerate dehydrogenase E1 component